MPERIRDHVALPRNDLDDQSYSLCVDVGMYLGEAWRRDIPGLDWSVVTKPKSSVDLHQPVIQSLGGKFHLNPRRLAYVFALKIADGKPAEDLGDYYDRWVEDLRMY